MPGDSLGNLFTMYRNVGGSFEPQLHSITLYLDKARFLADLGIDDHTIHVLLIDRAGHILWDSAGPLDPEAEDSLSSYLETLDTAA